MNTVAVIVPAHPARLANGMLAQALGSITIQSRPPDAIHVAIDNYGQGAASTRQRALEAADTDWVAFLDSDDLFLPPHLERLLTYAQETGADFVYSWYSLLQQGPNGQTVVLENDPIFPPTHFTNPWNPDDPIETTVTVLCRTELAKQVGFHASHELGGTNPGQNSGEDREFTLGCARAGAHISHLVEKTWLWRHWQVVPGILGNTSGLPTKGDGMLSPYGGPSL